MAKETDEKLFDVRVVERNIEKGLITREEYNQHLESLDDQEDNAETLEATFEHGVLEDEEEGEEGEEEEYELEDED